MLPMGKFNTAKRAVSFTRTTFPSTAVSGVTMSFSSPFLPPTMIFVVVFWGGGPGACCFLCPGHNAQPDTSTIASKLTNNLMNGVNCHGIREGQFSNIRNYVSVMMVSLCSYAGAQQQSSFKVSFPVFHSLCF